MKRYLLVAAIGLLSLSFLTTSCTKDEEETPTPTPVVDVRDQAIGDYDGDIILYLTTDLENADTTWAEDFSVVKNADNDLSINFIIDDNIEFKGTKIASADNGFTFDIENQTFVEDGSSYTITGYDFIELNGTNYHGAFETSSKEIAAAFSINIDGTDFIMIFGGVQK